LGSSIHPIGYISYHAGDHDAYGVIHPWIMTDHGWRPANGLLYNRQNYPRLWATLPDRRRGDEVQVPDLMSGKVELGSTVRRLTPAEMPVHSHTINRFANPSPHVHSYNVDAFRHNHGCFVGMDPGPKAIGKVTKMRRDDAGLSIDFKLDTNQFTDTISYLKNDMKRLLDAEIAKTIIGPNHARSILGLAPITKENSMSGTTRLKTPSKNIKRKDLGVAMRLLGLSDQDELLNAVALVQELKEGQKIYRAYELQKAKLSGVTIKIDSEDIAGVLTDAKGNYVYDTVQLVVDGKMLNVSGSEFVVVTPVEPVGEDALRVVQD